MYWKIRILGTLKKKKLQVLKKKRTYSGTFESAGIGLLNYIDSRLILALLGTLE